jgi:hypothetical protein
MVKFETKEERDLWIEVFLYYTKNEKFKLHSPEEYADKAVKLYKERDKL